MCELTQDREVEVGLSRFNRNLPDDTIAQLGEEGILGRSVMHDRRIPEAQVQCRWSFNAFQRPVDDLYPIGPGLLWPRLQVRFINLYYVGSRGLQAFDLRIDGCCDIQCQRFLIVVIVILRLLSDSERAWHGDLDA